MTVIINGSTGISPVTATGTSALVDGMTVGRGAGEVATNTAVGASALAANTTGYETVAVGTISLNANTTGNFNTATGRASLYSNTTGSYNSAFGNGALQNNTTASDNTAFGYQAGYSNTTGARNTFVGEAAGYLVTTGSDNTTLGFGALASGGGSGGAASNNVAIGTSALKANTASNNTAVGYQAGYSVTVGGAGLGKNTFLGSLSGYAATGYRNSFFGYDAGSAVTSGSSNVIIGGYNGNQGGLDIRTASNHIVLSDGDGNPRIFHSGSTLYSTLSASAGSFAVKTAAGGVITYDASSARYKDNIRDSSYGLAAVMQLRSAMFEYKDSGRTDVGFIAEEVDLVIPELVPKIDGVPEAVSYDRMVSVLVKAIQELKAEFDAYKEAHP